MMEFEQLVELVQDADVKKKLQHKVKIIETQNADFANLVESTGAYYVDRWSESQKAYILMRRERAV